MPKTVPWSKLSNEEWRTAHPTVRIYVSVEGPDGQLVIDGPLSMLRAVLDAVDRGAAVPPSVGNGGAVR